VEVGPATLSYGLFLNAVISFLLVSAAIFFLVVKPVNKLNERRKTEPDVVSTTRDCPECLSAIPNGASRCAFCTAEVQPLPEPIPER
jgi:large conductance mechanosensitive channel